MNDKLHANLRIIKERIALASEKSGRKPDSVRLIAVTKNHPVETLQALINLGVTEFGENRANEIEQKAPLLRGTFTMHMIGHLQTNKVNQVIPYVKWIQSIDREHLITRIDFLHRNQGKIKALVEVNTSGEASKTGCKPEVCRELCEKVVSSKSLEFCGLMTIGPLNAGERETKNAFALLRKLGEKCSDLCKKVELSMGMSEDFEIAISEGATMVRIGTLLVGGRDR